MKVLTVNYYVSDEGVDEVRQELIENFYASNTGMHWSGVMETNLPDLDEDRMDES